MQKNVIFDLGARPKSFAKKSKNHVEFNFHLISYFSLSSLAAEMSKNDYTFKFKCAQIITRGLYYANYMNFLFLHSNEFFSF